MAYLKILGQGSKTKKYEIDRDLVIIGRSLENAIPIDDPAVSSRHCQIVRDGRKFTLVDLDSTNGTMLNGVRVTDYRLSPGDIIRVGSVEILFDGDDILPLEEPLGADETQVTVRLPAGGEQTDPVQSPRFAPSRDNRWKWMLVMILLGIGTLGALAFFLLRLYRS